MARVKLPLEMANGVMARTIEDLRGNFDIKKVVGHFLDGKLKNWLEVRYYEEELEKVNELSESDPELTKKLCEILGVEYTEENIDIDSIQEKYERLLKLKQYTDDEEIIANIDSVAFNQEELADLYDKGIEKIYLCGGKFKIPMAKMNIEYVELNNAEVEYAITKENFILPTKLADLIEHNYIELDDFVVWRVYDSDKENQNYIEYFANRKIHNMNDISEGAIYYAWNFKKDEYFSFALPHVSLFREFVPYANKLILLDSNIDRKYRYSINVFDMNKKIFTPLYQSENYIDIHSHSNVNDDKLFFSGNDGNIILDIKSQEVKKISNFVNCLFKNMILTLHIERYYIYNNYKVKFENISSGEITEKELGKFSKWYTHWFNKNEYFLLMDTCILGINEKKEIKKYYDINTIDSMRCVHDGNSSRYLVFYEERYHFLKKLYVFDKQNKTLKIHNVDDMYISDMESYVINKFLYFKDKYKKYRIDLSKEFEKIEL